MAQSVFRNQPHPTRLGDFVVNTLRPLRFFAAFVSSSRPSW